MCVKIFGCKNWFMNCLLQKNENYLILVRVWLWFFYLLCLSLHWWPSRWCHATASKKPETNKNMGWYKRAPIGPTTASCSSCRRLYCFEAAALNELQYPSRSTWATTFLRLVDCGNRFVLLNAMACLLRCRSRRGRKKSTAAAAVHEEEHLVYWACLLRQPQKASKCCSLSPFKQSRKTLFIIEAGTLGQNRTTK